MPMCGQWSCRMIGGGGDDYLFVPPQRAPSSSRCFQGQCVLILYGKTHIACSANTVCLTATLYTTAPKHFVIAVTSGKYKQCIQITQRSEVHYYNAVIKHWLWNRNYYTWIAICIIKPTFKAYGLFGTRHGLHNSVRKGNSLEQGWSIFQQILPNNYSTPPDFKLVHYFGK